MNSARKPFRTLSKLPLIGQLVLALITIGILSACNSNDFSAGPSDDDNGVKADPSFANDIQSIFNRNGCTNSSCHGSAMQVGLDLRDGNSYASLVSVSSTETGSLRVESGDAENSYLIIKVEGRQAVGERMPINLPPLSSTDIQNLRNWIDAGAKQN